MPYIKLSGNQVMPESITMLKFNSAVSQKDMEGKTNGPSLYRVGWVSSGKIKLSSNNVHHVNKVPIVAISACPALR